MAHFVLVHGAFHGPWCFERLVEALARQGATSTTPELPLTSLAEDAAVVRRTLDREQGPVVLLGHSWGGAVVTAAGDHPAVAQLVLLAALAPDEGEGPSGGPVDIAPAFVAALRPVPGELLEVDSAQAAGFFFPDADPASARAAAAKLRAGRTGLPGERVERAAWRRKPTCYVVCSDDPIIRPASQRALAARTGGRVCEIAGDHSPFIARPQELAALLCELAK